MITGIQITKAANDDLLNSFWLLDNEKGEARCVCAKGGFNEDDIVPVSHKALSLGNRKSQESEMTDKLTWHDVLADEKEKPYFQKILTTVAAERDAGVTIYPPQKDVFNAFRFTELGDVKVVILGQDPYHGPGQAHGLAFSVRPGVAPPPSLVNMYKELEQSVPGFTRPSHGYLESWARQGVMLLNTVLTVQAGKAHSHANLVSEEQNHGYSDARLQNF